MFFFLYSYTKFLSLQINIIILSFIMVLQPLKVAQSNVQISTMYLFGVPYFCFNRNCESYDSCDQPRDGHVLGNISLVCYGDHGKSLQKDIAQYGKLDDNLMQPNALILITFLSIMWSCMIIPMPLSLLFRTKNSSHLLKNIYLK